MLRALLITVAAVGALAGYLVVDSLAVFTDQEANAANTFTTGTVALDDAPDSAVVTYSDMAPCDSVIGQLTLTNSGSLDPRYAMTTSADDIDGKALRVQLLLTIREKTANPCASEDGVVVFAAAALSTGAFGNPAQGAQAGDRVLAASASEDLCS